MSESLDHLKGRLDALFGEAKRLRVELESRERVDLHHWTLGLGECHEGKREDCKKCNQPHPVTERFVRYTLSEVYEKLTDGTMISLKPQVFTRCKVGETVAVNYETVNTWRVTFADGSVDAFHDRRYQTLKRNGAFGEEQC